MSNLSTELEVKLDTYRQVADVFRSTLSAREMDDTYHVIKRLEELEIVIAAFGRTQAGKSSLLNALLGYSNSDPNIPFSSSPKANRWSEYIEKNSAMTWTEISGLHITIQDTPGIGGDFPEHRAKAVKIAQDSDVILFVTAGDIVGEEKKAMDELIKTNKPLIIVINQCDILREDRIESIKNDATCKWPTLREMIVLAAGYPDPRLQKTPIIEELVKKISFTVQLRQEELIWRTVEEHFKDKKDKVARIILNQKSEDAKTLILTSAGSAAAVSAAIPSPLDEPGLTTIHISMVIKLGFMFGQSLSKQAAVAIIGLLAGAVVGKTVANLAFNFLPPGISNLARASTTFAHTEALGWAAFNYFKENYDPIPLPFTENNIDSKPAQ